MRRRLVSLIGLLICFAIVGSAFAAQDKMMSDPVSGKWSGDWGPNANDRNQIAAEFKFDGKALTGSFTPAGQTTAIPIQKATFDAKTGAVHMEADVKANGATVHYVIDGKVDKNVMKGSWNHDSRKGDFNIAKK
jgi:hypothetical protein